MLTSNPLTAMTARLGPYSPGRQATLRSPGQLLSRMSSALLEPVVKTTSATAHRGERGDGGTAGVEHGSGGLGRDVATDFGLVPGMLGGRVDHREALPRTRGAVEVQAGDFGPGRPPPFGERVAHFAERDRAEVAGVDRSTNACGADPPRPVRPATPSGRNLQDTSVSISSPVGEVDGQVQRADIDPLCARGTQPHLDALLVGVPPGDVVERVEIEVGVEFSVDHREHIAVELRGYARTVVVGTHQPVDILDQVGAQQQAVAGLQGVRQRGKELGARTRRQIADRRAKEGDQPAADRAGSCRGALRNRHIPRRSRRRDTPVGSPRPPH